MCITMYWDNSHWAKLTNHSMLGLWLGVAENYPVGIYHVYNPKSIRINLTENVSLLNARLKTCVTFYEL